jgi:hypothetical protein
MTLANTGGEDASTTFKEQNVGKSRKSWKREGEL